MRLWRTGGRLLSCYRLPTGADLWILTEADRSATIHCADARRILILTEMPNRDEEAEDGRGRRRGKERTKRYKKRKERQYEMRQTLDTTLHFAGLHGFP